jgi:chaperonin GroES
MKFTPIGERVLAKPVEREETTVSGIVLPDTAKEKPQTAEVVAVGDSVNGGVEKGSVVVHARFSGTEIELDGEKHLILDADDLLGIIER